MEHAARITARSFPEIYPSPYLVDHFIEQRTIMSCYGIESKSIRARSFLHKRVFRETPTLDVMTLIPQSVPLSRSRVDECNEYGEYWSRLSECTDASDRAGETSHYDPNLCSLIYRARKLDYFPTLCDTDSDNGSPTSRSHRVPQRERFLCVVLVFLSAQLLDLLETISCVFSYQVSLHWEKKGIVDGK